MANTATTQQNRPIAPLSKKIGIIGGGQLGKMMIQEAKKMGFYVTVLDPTEHCPCHSLCDEHIVAAFDDGAAIQALGERSDVITYELEHIGVSQLEKLENAGKEVYPTCKSLRIIQNKITQKQTLQAAGIPVPDFSPVGALAEIQEKCTAFPMILKAATGGYDGKGNYVLNTPEDIPAGYAALGGGKLPLMLETFAPFEMEVSVLACRGIGGEVAVYPVGQNIHRDSILDKTIVPAPISDETTRQAMATAERVMSVFDGVGMFCVEMFVLPDGTVLVNEVAPRPHNSGHYTIEACNVSQFEQHIRAIAGLPLAKPRLLSPSVMVNLLGAAEAKGPAVTLGAQTALALDGLSLHVYGKTLSVPKRKMGHMTICGESVAACLDIAEKAEGLVTITALATPNENENTTHR